MSNEEFETMFKDAIINHLKLEINVDIDKGIKASLLFDGYTIIESNCEFINIPIYNVYGLEDKF